MDITKLPLSIVSKLKDFGIGIAKGVGTLAEAPGALADLVTGTKITAPTGTLQKSQQWQQTTTPSNKTQSFGHAIGSLSPGTELITPGLQKMGMPAGLAMGFGLVTDLVTPGPGESSTLIKLGRQIISEIPQKSSNLGKMISAFKTLVERQGYSADFIEKAKSSKALGNSIESFITENFKKQDSTLSGFKETPLVNSPVKTDIFNVYHGSQVRGIKEFNDVVGHERRGGITVKPYQRKMPTKR